MDRSLTEIEAQAFHAAGVGLSVIGMDFSFLSVNDRYCEIVGRSRGELVRSSLVDVSHPDDVGADIAGMLKLADGTWQNYMTEKRYVNPDGKITWVRLSAVALRDSTGKVDAFLGTVEDISGQKNLDAQLQEAELRFQQALDAIPDLILIKGPGSRLYWANRSFRECYGMSNEELEGIIDAPFSPADQTLQYVRDDAYVFQTGNVLETREPIHDHRGTVRMLHTVKSPIRDETGKITMTVGVSRDITEKLAAEAALEEHRARLVHSAKMSALGEMAGGIAHEINNPLGIIQGTITVLQGALASGDTRGLESGLKTIYDTSARIAKVVKGLRFFSRSAEYDPTALVEPAQILQDTIGLCGERFRFSQVELRVAMQAQHEIECRPTEIAQVLLNLLNNAYDAVVGTEEPWVEVGAVEEGDLLVFQVTDSGLGIPPAVAEKIFDPFFTTKEVGRGTGLGLSLSKGIAESHGGSLRYMQGMQHTTFRLELSIRQKTKH